MKKFILPALIALLFSACTTEEYITREYITEEYYTVDTYSKTYKVYWNMNNKYYWEEAYDETGLYYYCTIEDRNLTNEVFQYGQMNAYLYYVPEGASTSVLSPLPFSDFITGTDNAGNFIKWEEQVTVEFAPELITFILKLDDHEPLPPFYSSHEFAIRFMW